MVEEAPDGMSPLGDGKGQGVATKTARRGKRIGNRRGAVILRRRHPKAGRERGDSSTVVG